MPMPSVDALTDIGALNRTNATANQDAQPGDHNLLQAKHDAMRAAIRADIDALWALLAEINTVDIAGELSPANAVPPFTALAQHFAGVTMNPPIVGSPWYPDPPLSRWRASKNGLRRVMLLGDSITQGTVYGYDSWASRLARMLGWELGGLAGLGFRGLWLPEWTFNGTWAQITPSSAADVAPFSEGFQGTGGTGNTIVWSKPAGTTVASFEILWIDAAGGNQWSYRVDSNTPVNGPAVLGDNKLKRLQVNTPVGSTLTLRCGTGAPAQVASFVASEMYSIPNGWNGPGIVVDNVGRDGSAISKVLAIQPLYRPSSASGPNGWASLPDLLQPDLITAMWRNDGSSDTGDTGEAAWIAANTGLVTRCGSYADVLLMNVYESTSPAGATILGKYRADLKAVAAAYGAGLIDFRDAWTQIGLGTFTAATTAGLLNADATHPAQAGHNDIAARIGRLLRVFS